MNGYLEEWNTGRALDSSPELFAEFVDSVADRAATSSKGKHVNVRDYNRSHCNALRAAMGAVRHDAVVRHDAAAAGAPMDTSIG